MPHEILIVSSEERVIMRPYILGRKKGMIAGKFAFLEFQKLSTAIYMGPFLRALFFGAYSTSFAGFMVKLALVTKAGIGYLPLIFILLRVQLILAPLYF
jgi:hypothetical protein